MGSRFVMYLPLAGIISRAASGVSYLLQATGTASDQTFTDAQVLNTAAEGVETGSLTVVDTSTGSVELLSNKFRLKGTAVWGTTGTFSQALTREAGMALFGKMTSISASSSFICFSNSSVLDNGVANVRYAPYPQSDGTLSFLINAPTLRILDLETGLSDGTERDFCLVLGGYDANGVPDSNGLYGVAMYSKFATTWDLRFRHSIDNTATLYAQTRIFGGTQDFDDFKVAQSDATLKALGTPNNTNSSVTTGDTFTHIADCYIESIVTTLPSSGNLDIEFRRQDNSNKWIVRTTSAGAISLIEVVATVETTRIGPVSSAVAAGTTIKIIANGATIDLFSKDVNRGSYASASNFSTDTGGKIVFSSGAITHLSDWKLSAYSALGNY